MRLEVHAETSASWNSRLRCSQMSTVCRSDAGGALFSSAVCTLLRRWKAETTRASHSSSPFSSASRSRSEEHTSELQSLMRISYAVFCLKKKNTIRDTYRTSRKQYLSHSTRLPTHTS